MTRHWTRWILAVVLGLAAQVAFTAEGDATRKPNIVFIMADDLGYADLGCTGSDLYETPNIDAFAYDSLYFRRAHSSHPTCSPSRAAILTGKYPARLGIVSHGAPGGVTDGDGDFIKAREYTLGEAMRDAGYTTCHIGKWHVGFDGRVGPKDEGFKFDMASNQFCCPGSYRYPYVDQKADKERQNISTIPGLEDRDPNDHLTMVLGEKASTFIAEHKDEPFFLNLWYYAVHTPIVAQKDKVEKYKALKKARPNARHRNANYAGLVEHLDDSVGLVLRAIEDNGLADNTIVIFFSDNGGAAYNNITVNYPLREGKVTQYLGGVRVPMFIRWPGVTRPGSTCDELVIGHDLYPTILAMAGAKGNPRQNAELDGLNLAPLMEDTSVSLGRDELHWLRYPVVFHYANSKDSRVKGPCGSILKGDWRLIEFLKTPHGMKQAFELYNLKDDIGEQNNLAEAMPDKVKELKEAMDAWRREVNAPAYDMAYREYEKVE